MSRLFGLKAKSNSGGSGNTSNNTSHSRTGSSTSGPPPAPATPERSELADSVYNDRAQRLIALANDLKALGAGHILDIPRVVFIGNQSAGKSSVVEAVTGIKVPRDGGTCTRCPMECTVTRKDGPWTCTISLRLDHGVDGRVVEGKPKTIVFAEVNDKSNVELWLRRAQAAILCRSDGVLTEALVEPFKTKTQGQLKEMQKDGRLLSFSFNTVEVAIHDREGTDLSFVDLPGIIHNHEDDSMTSLVMRLVKENIKGKNTLIVVTLPMTDDIQTQQAVAIARKADFHGHRTIGVVTKPDMLTEGDTGSLATWKATLEGTEHELRHGYYAVKLPNDATRAAGHSGAKLRELEMSFFSSTEPWATFEDRSRFGIPNFVKSTSDLLVNLIERNLPALKAKVEELLAQDLAAQAKLPPLLDANLPPLYLVLKRVTDFCKAFEQTVQGKTNEPFTHTSRAVYKSFKNRVDVTKPQFDLRSAGRGSSGLITTADVREKIQDHTTWQFPGFVPFEAAKFFVLRHVAQWEDPALHCFDEVSSNLTNWIDKLLAEPAHFERFAILKKWIRDIIAEEQEACADKTAAMIKTLFSFENTSPLMFQNTNAFTDAKQAWFNRYHPHGNPWTQESTVMAEIDAYLNISSQRFIDNVPMAIENMLHQALAARLTERLMQEVIELDKSDNALKDMLKEEPRIAKERERLQQRIEKLQAIKERLLEFERGSTYDAALLESPEEWVDSDSDSNSRSPSPMPHAQYAEHSRESLASYQEVPPPPIWGNAPPMQQVLMRSASRGSNRVPLPTTYWGGA